MKYFFFILAPIIIYFFNSYLKNISLIKNYSGEIHQKFVGEKKVPLSGGIFLIFILLFFFLQDQLILCFFLLLIFLIGFSSDISFVTSPARRLVFQSLVTLIFVFSLDVQIFSTRVIFLDHILSYYIPSLIFTSFCLIILMNGTNFIDGLNGLVIGYYLIVLLILFKLGLLNDLFINNSELQFFVYFLFILFLLNIKNKLYLGDSGSYLLSFFIGYILILIYNGNLIFSPFFIVLLLWYPCFENLFSIIRKFRLKKSPVKPDNRHFHHFFVNFFKKENEI